MLDGDGQHHRLALSLELDMMQRQNESLQQTLLNVNSTSIGSKTYLSQHEHE